MPLIGCAQWIHFNGQTLVLSALTLDRLATVYHGQNAVRESFVGQGRNASTKDTEAGLVQSLYMLQYGKRIALPTAVLAMEALGAIQNANQGYPSYFNVPILSVSGRWWHPLVLPIDVEFLVRGGTSNIHMPQERFASPRLTGPLMVLPDN
jgi:hypothetical protein